MKYSREGIRIPERCKFCGSRKTMLSTYKTGEKFIECEGCYTVIRQVKPSEWRVKRTYDKRRGLMQIKEVV